MDNLSVSKTLCCVPNFLDSVRTMVTHQRELDAGNKQSLDARLDNQAKEYRGQRNFYITGFALFLIL